MTPRLLSGLRRALWTVLGQLLVALPAAGAPTATEKAAAEALFQEGTELLSAGNFALACEKFEASNAIEPGLGTKLWLADCYDRAGRTASAWGLFTEAAAMAQQSGQSDRERAANQRASDLEQRLSKLELKLPPGGLPPDLTVTMDGVTIPGASLGSALPVDPGDHALVLKAPGYKSLTLNASVPIGPVTIPLDVPVLEREPERPKSELQSDALDPSKGSPPGSTQRTLGWALGGLGVVSFVGAGVLAYRAHDLDSQSRSHCLANDPNRCDSEGTSLRDEARTYGNVATVATIAGVALAGTGVVLLLTAPSSKESVRVGATFTPTSSSLVLAGRL